MANANPSRSGGTINEQIQAIAAVGPKKAVEDGALINVPIGEVGPHPDQPRTIINRERLKELKASLVRTHGVMTPIEVRRALPEEQKAEPQFQYRLISGQRRLEAYRELNGEQGAGAEKSDWGTIRALLKVGVDDADALERALIENIQRDELLPLDEAEAYSRIRKKRNLKNLREVAAAVGKKEERVKDLLRLNEAPEVIKEALRQGLKIVRAEEGDDGSTHERKETLRRLEVSEALKFMQLFEHYVERNGGRTNRGATVKAAETIRKVIERALEDGWGTRRVDDYVKSVRSGREAPGESAAPPPLFKSDEKQVVVYRGRMGSAATEERARLRQLLAELQAQLA